MRSRFDLTDTRISLGKPSRTFAGAVKFGASPFNLADDGLPFGNDLQKRSKHGKHFLRLPGSAGLVSCSLLDPPQSVQQVALEVDCPPKRIIGNQSILSNRENKEGKHC